MKAINVKLTSVCVSLIVLSLMLTSVSSVKGDFDEKTLVALWLFDEGSGKVLKDQTKNGHDGKIIGAKWTKGKFGKALEFDGKDDMVEIDPHADLNPAEQITVMAWVKSTVNTYNAVWSVVSKYSAYILGPTGGRMCFIIHNGAWQYESCHTPKDYQAWIHYTGTYDQKKGEKHLYVDGVLESTSGPRGPINADGGGIHLAHRECCAGENHLAALLDEVAIFNVVLDKETIKDIYARGWDKLFAVSSKGKLATAWGDIKTQ
jgi:WD40 repeat protein